MRSSDDEIIAAAREGFLEEARDNLVQFEHALLAIEVDPADAEAVNTAFRAAHTIKGTAGLFGFEAVVHFTHEVESALDAMRDGTLAVNAEAIALLLAGRDQMDRLIAEVGTAAADPELALQSEQLGARLRVLRGAAAPAPAAAAPLPAAPATAQDQRSWHLSLQMGRDALRNGLDPMSFIRYLDTLGEVRGIRCVDHALPELAELDPESCHLTFEIRLASGATREAIEAVFEFLAEDCDLVVLGPDPAQKDYETLLARRAPTPEAREQWLAHWQVLAGPNAPPLVERRAAPAAKRSDRRTPDGDRRRGKTDRRAGSGGDEVRFVRIRADKLDRLIDLIGELVIASSGAQTVAAEENSPRFVEAATRIHDIVQEARDGALGLRMVPIGETFARFQRVVRDVGRELGKEVELQISGGDTELDKSMVEVISDPLMHLVRNSLDHGLEAPADRQAAGKPAMGRLALHAYHESGSVVIEVSDDGRGLDRERILAKAVAKGLVAEDAVLDDAQVNALIFEAGFSTAEQVTNLSGRGVGMDVVRRNVEALRGQIKVASHSGRGTTVQVRLPLTLAIIDGFLTQVGAVHYVIPLEAVAECIDLPPSCRAGGETTGTFDLRGDVLPWLDLARFYGQTDEEAGSRARRSLVLVRSGTQRLGLVVDRLLGEHQTVIKPLAAIFSPLKALAGSTILGSGEVALVLDMPGLIDGAAVADRIRAARPRPPPVRTAACNAHAIRLG